MARDPVQLRLFQLFQEHRKVSTDTRKIDPGSIFFALKGARFDGNEFAAKALEAGAAYAVVDDPKVAGISDRMILVPDVLKALQDLATAYALSFDVPRIGITGSNGKTTVKELITAVLRKKFRVHATSGNYNNHIGVPLTILSCPEDADIMVLEMGANKQGDIRELTEIGCPTHGLVTVIGRAHLEGMGGIEGVKKTKGEMYDFLAEHNGVAFVASDLPFLKDLSKHVRQRIFYGCDEATPHHILTGVLNSGSLYAEGGVHFSGNGEVYVKSHLFGSVHFHNILTAMAVGRYFGVTPGDMVDAIEAYQPGDRRIEWISRGEHRILLDAYNANPDSTIAAVAAFARLQDPRKILVLGEMLELGKYAVEGHRQVIDEAMRSDWSAVLLIGPSYEKAASPELPEGWQVFQDIEELTRAFTELTRKPSTILIKGSRGMALERLTDRAYVPS